MTAPEVSDEEVVTALLSRAGIEPSEAERTRFVREYAQQRALTGLLYGVAEARYEAPALGFDPLQSLTRWS